MQYAALEQKLRLVPERDFDFVSRFLDFVLSEGANKTDTESGEASPMQAAPRPQPRRPDGATGSFHQQNGASRPEAAQPSSAPRPAATPQAKLRFCSNCGVALQSGIKFCMECGSPVN